MIQQDEISIQRFSKINSIVLFSIIIFGLLALFSVFLFDERLFLWLRQNPASWQKNVWVEIAGQFGKGGFLVWLLLVWIWATGRSRSAIIALLALLLTFPAVWSVKIATCRPRPRDVIEKEAEVKNTNFLVRSWSFPSGDVASTFAVAAVAAPFVALPATAFMFIIAGAVGITRMLVFAHYLADVFGGAAVGIFVGWLALQIGRKTLPPNCFQFKGYRIVAAIGVIAIPFSVWLFRGLSQLFIFLEAGLIFIAVFYLITIVGRRMNGSNSSPS